MAGLDLAKVVSCTKTYEWTQTEWKLGSGYGTQDAPKFHVVAYDYGVKFNILRMLAERGCRVTVVPAQTPAADVLALKPDGVFLSNGPGDPEPCDYAIARHAHHHRDGHADLRHLPGPPDHGAGLRREDLQDEVRPPRRQPSGQGPRHRPRVASPARTTASRSTPATLPANLRATHVSLFDGTLQGLARTDKPAFCFQGHPEASPGPHDIAYLFDRFIALDDTRTRRRTERMPKRTDLKSILIIGAGPIIIGQACEFDYSGAQACKALREEGYKVILVN